MPKISAEQRQARRDHIAQAAVEQFAQRGIHSTSMANIIGASGLSAGAIYTHFAGKDEIIAYAAQTTVSSMLKEFEGVVDADPIPSPEGLMSSITERIAHMDVPTGFIVQVWAEAITNPVVREAANIVYATAFDFFRDYAAIWLSAQGGLSPRQVRTKAPRQARLMVSLVYAHILQTSLIDSHDVGDFITDAAAALTALTR